MKKIVLMCNQGMSTSILVKKMNEAAQEMGYAAEVEAYPYAEAREKAADADLVLLGPQVRFALKKVQAQIPGKRVEIIDMRLYGRMDGKGILEAARAEIGD